MARFFAAKKNPRRNADASGDSLRLLDALKAWGDNVRVIQPSADQTDILEFEADSREMQKKLTAVPDSFWVEPEIGHWPEGKAPHSKAKIDRQLNVLVHCRGTPLPQAIVTIFPDS